MSRSVAARKVVISVVDRALAQIILSGASRRPAISPPQGASRPVPAVPPPGPVPAPNLPLRFRLK